MMNRHRRPINGVGSIILLLDIFNELINKRTRKSE